MTFFNFPKTEKYACINVYSLVSVFDIIFWLLRAVICIEKMKCCIFESVRPRIICWKHFCKISILNIHVHFWQLSAATRRNVAVVQAVRKLLIRIKIRSYVICVCIRRSVTSKNLNCCSHFSFALFYKIF